MRAVGLCVLLAGAVLLTIAPAFGMNPVTNDERSWVWSIFYAALSVALLARYVGKE